MNTFRRFVIFSRVVSLLLVALGTVSVRAADDSAGSEAEYTKVITERSDKIVRSLKLENLDKAGRVATILAQHYRDLRAIHDPRDEGIKAAKADKDLSKEDREQKLSALNAAAEEMLAAIHAPFLAALKQELSDEQVDQVKDGLTYEVVPKTFQVYKDYFPKLSVEQQSTILGYLKEAREKAMDGSTSKEKHAWFGKYKGKINNYLSTQGLDLKAAEKEFFAKKKAPAEATDVSKQAAEAGK
jgi:hypothetical protein